MKKGYNVLLHQTTEEWLQFVSMECIPTATLIQHSNDVYKMSSYMELAQSLVLFA